MAANKRKILEAARKHAQKGAKDKALKEYQKLLTLEPKDARLRLEVGDALRRWGQVPEAVVAYKKVADQYMSEGFDARAVAVFKQIQNLDPEDFSYYQPLADLYQRMGLTGEAIAALQSAADGHHKNGNKREALEMLRKMATLDPTNTTSRMKVADLLRQEGLDAEAIAEYDEVSSELERQGDREASARVFESILEIEPKRVATLLSLTTSLIERNMGARAEPFAKRLVEASPDEPSHFEMLARVYQEQRNDDACADVYRKLADLHRRRGDEDKAREIMQRFVPTADLAAGGDVDITLGAEDEFDDLGMEGDDGLLDEDLLANDDLLEGGASLENAIEADDDPIDLMSPIAEQAPEEIQEIQQLEEIQEPEEIPEPAEELEPDAPPPVPPSGDPDQLLAEASVYLRYGESAQAIANLEAILAKDPNHRKALEKLGEALADSGDDLRAVETWERAAGLAREAGDSDALSVLRGRIASLDEEAAAALDDGESEVDDEDLDIALDDDEVEAALQEDDVAPELTADDDPSIGDDPDTDEIALGDIEIDIDESTLGGEVEASDAEDDVGDVDTTVDFDGDDGEIEEEAQGLSASVTAQIGEDLEEADFYMQQGLHDEAVVIYRRILLASPDHPTAKLRLGEIEAAGGGDAVAAPDPSLEDTAVEEEEESFDVDDADLDDDIDVSDEIAEDDAAAEVEVAVPEVDETTQPAEVEADDDEAYLDVVPDDVVAPPQAASAGDAGFDLAAELSDAFDDDANASSARGATGGDDNFAAVFDEFKKGVSKQLTDSDHEAHYDLGIAYREMGLHDDAMTEFRKAMTSPSRQIDCLHMLGICAIEVGRGEEAIGFLEQALQSSEVSDEQALAAQFEVGRAYELTGDLDRARTAFETVRDVEPGFCDVEERIENLGSGEKPDAETGTDGFENFDDLMEDDEDDVPTPEAAETYESFDDVFEDDDDGDEPEAPAAVPKAAPAKSKKRPAAKKTAKKKKKKISFV